MLKGVSIPPLNGQPPKKIIFFLDGYCSRNAEMLYAIAPKWQPSLPDCEFIWVQAPLSFDEFDPIELRDPPGERRKWFNLNLANPDEMLTGAQAAEPLVNSYIDEILINRNLKPENAAIFSFSQGAMTALHAIPRRNSPLACVVAYCGLIIAGENLANEKNSNTPVLLIHGTHDYVVPFAYMQIAENHLKEAGVPVSVLAPEGETHTYSDLGLQAALTYIQQQFLNTEMAVNRNSTIHLNLHNIRQLCKSVNDLLASQSKESSEVWMNTSRNDTEEDFIIPDVINSDFVKHYSFYKLGIFDEDIDQIERALKNTINTGMDNEKTRAVVSLFSMLEIRLKNLLNLDRHNKFNIFSIGEGCFPRNITTRWGIKKSRVYGELTTPFDLAVHRISAVIECLENNFSTYFGEQTIILDEKKQWPYHRNLGIEWVHEHLPIWTDNNFSLLKQRYQRRIKNFYQMLSEEKHMLFFMNSESAVYNATLHDDQMRRTLFALQKLTNQPITLFFVATHYHEDHKLNPVEQVLQETHGTGAIYAFDISIPDPNYVRFEYEHYSTSNGVRFEMRVLEMLLKVMEERENTPLKLAA